MAIELRIDVDKTIGERDIHYCEIKSTYQGKSNQKDVVFARYSQERTIERFLKQNPLSQIGVKEKPNTKTVVFIKITSKIYLSKVNKETYDTWKISKENSKNNLIL